MNTPSLVLLPIPLTYFPYGTSDTVDIGRTLFMAFHAKTSSVENSLPFMDRNQ